MEQRNSNEQERHSLTDLVRELRDDTTTLVRQEILLARVEAEESVRAIWQASRAGLSGLIVLYVSGLFLLASVTALIFWGLRALDVSPELSLFLAPLIVSASLAAFGGAMVMRAKRKTENVSFERTARTMEENKEWLENKMQ